MAAPPLPLPAEDASAAASTSASPAALSPSEQAVLLRAFAASGAGGAPDVSALLTPAHCHHALALLRSKYALAGNPRWWWVYDDALAVAARGLALHSHVVLDGFLDAASTRALAGDVRRAHASGALAEKGALTDARHGRNTNYSRDATRGDYLAWFEGLPEEPWWSHRGGGSGGGGGGALASASAPPDSLPGYMLKVSTLMEQLKVHLPAELGGITVRSRAMVTCYPPGARSPSTWTMRTATAAGSLRCCT